MNQPLLKTSSPSPVVPSFGTPELWRQGALTAARFRFSWYQRYTRPGMKWNWFTEDMSKHLDQFLKDLLAGKRPKLAIQAPPQFGKSRTARDFITYLAGRAPQMKSMFTSYSDDLGVATNKEVAAILQSPQFKELFPQTLVGIPGSTMNTSLIEYGAYGGSFRNTTVQGQINGMGLDLGVVDDPVKGRAEASSKALRDKTWKWFTDDFLGRFADGAGMLIIQTRWHMDDLLGRAIDTFGDDLKVLTYPAIATEDEAHRKEGDSLFPEFKSKKFLMERRAVLTEASWESLYQQNPIIVGGGMFPVEKFGEPLPEMPRRDVVSAVRYWDKAGCLVAGTMVETIRGSVPIENVCIGELVKTQNGYKRVSESWLSGYADKLVTVIFSNGATLTGTADHPVYVEGGYWIGLGDLVHSDRVVTLSEIDSWEGKEIQRSKNGSSWDGDTFANQEDDTSTVSSGTKIRRSIFTTPSIEKSGCHILEVSPAAVISTTLMETGITTQSKILNAYQLESTSSTTPEPPNFVPRCLDGIRSTVKHFEQLHKKLFSVRRIIPAKVVEKALLQGVSRHNFAGENLPDTVVGNKTGVPVYNLTVQSEHAYFANGVLVHNTEGGGAYTSGVLMLKLKNGTHVVADVRRGQWGALDRENIISQTTHADGKLLDFTNYRVYVEQEPGSGGKESAESTVRMLAGFVVEADRVTGKKESRAEPYAAQVQAGNVGIVAGDWLQPFIEEHEYFPTGKYKDQVDAAAGAFNKIALDEPTYDSSFSWVG